MGGDMTKGKYIMGENGWGGNGNGGEMTCIRNQKWGDVAGHVKRHVTRGSAGILFTVNQR